MTTDVEHIGAPATSDASSDDAALAAHDTVAGRRAPTMPPEVADRSVAMAALPGPPSD